MMMMLSVIVFIVLLLMGLPIAYGILATALFGMAFVPNVDLITVMQKTVSGLNSFTLLAVPMFILAANLMNMGNISQQLVDFCLGIVGHIRGGMGYANVLVSMLFAGISGSSQADTAGIGKILIPAMMEEGYTEDTAAGVTIASSTLGVIIPPSIPMVVYSSVASCSISALFMGGIIPGILIGGGQMMVIFYLAKKYDLPRHPKLSFKEFCGVMFRSIPGLITPILILGGVLGGFMTATESACVACIYALFLGMGVFRTIKLKDMKGILVDTLLLNSISLFALATANAMGQLLAYYNLSSYVKVFFANYADNRVVFMLMVIALYLFLGTFMDACPAIILFAPILLGTAETLGITSVQMGLVIVITLAIGQLTPPYVVCLMLGSKIADMPMQRAFKAIIPYIAISLAVVILLAFFPQIGNVFG